MFSHGVADTMSGSKAMTKHTKEGMSKADKAKEKAERKAAREEKRRGKGQKEVRVDLV
jgi:hypothetical protein